MTKTTIIRLSAVVLFLVGAWVAYTQQGKQASNKLNKLKEDLYEIEGDGGNVAFYITNEGVILVDDKFEYDFNDIVDKVKSVTNQPIKYVLNTHHHGDHTGSNAKFLPTADVISTLGHFPLALLEREPHALDLLRCEQALNFTLQKTVLNRARPSAR